MTAASWLSATEWHRVGHGSTMQFYATDEEVAVWLVKALPEELGPFRLVGHDPVEVSRGRYVWRPFECAPADWLSCRLLGSMIRWKWFIRSLSLTPVMPIGGGEGERDWSLNGLIDLQHGSQWHGRTTASSLGHASKVRHELTGEMREHAGYRLIYDSLRRAIRLDARLPTVTEFPDGNRVVDRRLALMTTRAAAEARAGKKFDVEPDSGTE